MKRTTRVLTFLLGVILMLTLFGCGRQKYKLQFDGSGFESKKTAYAAGDRVSVYYGMIATDTDYHFYIDADVSMTQDYDDDRGYVLTFVMPAHDVTLRVESNNSMEYMQGETMRVTFLNAVETADVWILPQTEENVKSSLWGTATIGKLGAGEQREVGIDETDGAETYIIRIIDDDHAYYAVKDVRLGDGYSIRFQTSDTKYDAVIEIVDADENVLTAEPAFVGVFGAR